MICVIEDDSNLRDALIALVESLGYEAIPFESAEEFLASSHLSEASCLVLDHHLPGLSGLELQNQLLESGYRTAIIMMSASDDPSIPQRALRAGAVAFFLKPFLKDDLASALEDAFK